MSFPRYEKYKDSGVEWLGEVPEHWDVKKIKYISNKIIDGAHLTPTYVENGIPFLRVTDIQTKAINLDDVKFIPENEHAELKKRCNPERNDVLLSKNGTIGITKVIEWDWEFSIFVSLCLMKLKLDYINPYFFNYQFDSYSIEQQIKEGSKQTSVINLHLEQIKELIVIQPHLEEQKLIVSFLDRETAKIDDLISEQQKLIELLKEKRQAVISHAVTKGLNPDAKMKDSGIEWLGEVPESWRILKFLRCVDIAEGQVDPEKEPYSSMILLAPNHIESGTGRLLFIETAEEQSAESGKYLCKSGDTVYSKIRPALRKVCTAPDDCLCSADMYPLRCHSGLTNLFLFWFILSEPFSAFAILESDRVAMPKINRESLKNVSLAVPPESEQMIIIKFLYTETSKLDTLISEAQKAITLLQERRTALISAAVTGKIDVRGFVPDSESGVAA